MDALQPPHFIHCTFTVVNLQIFDVRRRALMNQSGYIRYIHDFNLRKRTGCKRFVYVHNDILQDFKRGSKMQVKQNMYIVSKDAGDRTRSHPIHPQYHAVAQDDLSTDGPKVFNARAVLRKAIE
jgi:hypothetical protein